MPHQPLPTLPPPFEEKKPFFKSVIDTVTGFFSGGLTGAITGGVLLAAIGAGAAAVATGFLGASASDSLLSQAAELLNFKSVAPITGPAAPLSLSAAALTGATVLGLAGTAIGGGLGTITGAVTGWVNSRPSELAHQQEISRSQATGLTMGAALSELAHMQQHDAVGAGIGAVGNATLGAMDEETTHWRTLRPSKHSSNTNWQESTRPAPNVIPLQRQP